MYLISPAFSFVLSSINRVRGDWPNDQDFAETFVGLCLYVFGNVTDVMKGLVRLLHSVP